MNELILEQPRPTKSQQWCRRFQIICLAVIILAIGCSAKAEPIDDAVALAFEWLTKPAAEGDRSAFDKDVALVAGKAADARMASQSVAILRDKLAYHRDLVDSGQIEERELWPLAEKLTGAKQRSVSAKAAYNLVLISVSQRWGKDR